MGAKRSFRAVIEGADGGGAYVRVPFDVEQAFGKKRVRVKAVIEGQPYRGSLVRMGGVCHVLGILKEIRVRTGKVIGDQIRVTVEEDLEPRTVTVPPDLARALAGDPAARAAFEAYSYSHQREYVRHIEDAKRAQTRADRIAKTLRMLKERSR